MTSEQAQALIKQECDALCALLLRKNTLYKNSALEPANTFCQASAIDQIAVRCDDKLKRIANMGGLARVLGDAAPDGEDTVQDLLGYLVLARVAAKVHGGEKRNPLDWRDMPKSAGEPGGNVLLSNDPPTMRPGGRCYSTLQFHCDESSQPVSADSLQEAADKTVEAMGRLADQRHDEVVYGCRQEGTPSPFDPSPDPDRARASLPVDPVPPAYVRKTS